MLKHLLHNILNSILTPIENGLTRTQEYAARSFSMPDSKQMSVAGAMCGCCGSALVILGFVLPSILMGTYYQILTEMDGFEGNSVRDRTSAQTFVFILDGWLLPLDY